jgi:hypothetical protein
MNSNQISNWGGARQNAGRKPKAIEDRLVLDLCPYDEIAKLQLIEGVKSGDFNFIRLFYAYRYGMPNQRVDVTTNGKSVNNMFMVPQQVGQNIINNIPEANVLDDSEPENIPTTEEG